MRKFQLLVVLVSLLAAAEARGADFTLWGGRVDPGKVTIENARRALDGSAVWGFRLSHGFVPFIGLEHTLGWDRSRPPSTSTERDSQGWVYNSNVIVHAPFVRIKPYATVGIGFMNDYGADPYIGKKFAVNYGGGIKFRNLAGPFGVVFDIRGYRTKSLFSEPLNLLEISGGVMFSFP